MSTLIPRGLAPCDLKVYASQARMKKCFRGVPHGTRAVARLHPPAPRAGRPRSPRPLRRHPPWAMPPRHKTACPERGRGRGGGAAVRTLGVKVGPAAAFRAKLQYGGGARGWSCEELNCGKLSCESANIRFAAQERCAAPAYVFRALMHFWAHVSCGQPAASKLGKRLRPICEVRIRKSLVAT